MKKCVITRVGNMLADQQAPVMLRASKVPSSRLGRLFHYGCKSGLVPLKSLSR
jgi:hypothetical protein